MNFEKMREKYAISDGEQRAYESVLRKRAWWDLDALIDICESNNYCGSNEGRRLSDISEAEAESIIEQYLKWRSSDYAINDEFEDMRSAVMDVTGIVC